MVMVASTLISGLTPRRTFENTTMGRVLLPGPEVKLEITRSSQDRVKASSHPGQNGGEDNRQRDDEKHLQRAGAQIHGGFLKRRIESRQARIDDHRHIGHGKCHVPDGHGGDAAPRGPADELFQGDEQQQQGQSR